MVNIKKKKTDSFNEMMRGKDLVHEHTKRTQ